MEKVEKFPNLHSKTIASVTAILVPVLTWFVCESGLLNG